MLIGITIALSKKEPGCLVFNVKQDKKNPQRFTVYEEFVDEQAFKLHQQRVARSDWGQVTKNVKRHYQINSPYNA